VAVEDCVALEEENKGVLSPPLPKFAAEVVYLIYTV
jgi:hypothetical protein